MEKSSCSGSLGEGCRADVELILYSPKESPVSLTANLYLCPVGGRQTTWAEPKTVGDHVNSTQKRP